MESLNIWGHTLVDAMSALWSKLAAFVPNFLAFIVILIVGYLVARFLSAALKRALTTLNIDRFSTKIGISGTLERAGIRLEVSHILSRIIFWLLMLTFLVSATESLGLPRVSSTIDSFVLYLPKVIGAVFILMVGLFISQFMRDVVASGAEGLGIEYARSLANAAYVLLSVIVILLAIGQLDLETEILGEIIAIIVISAGAAAALAFGLGARKVAADVLAGTYVRELYREGDKIRIGEIEGTVTQVTPLKTELLTPSGTKVTIPNGDLASAVVETSG